MKAGPGLPLFVMMILAGIVAFLVELVFVPASALAYVWWMIPLAAALVVTVAWRWWT